MTIPSSMAQLTPQDISGELAQTKQELLNIMTSARQAIHDVNTAGVDVGLPCVPIMLSSLLDGCWHSPPGKNAVLHAGAPTIHGPIHGAVAGMAEQVALRGACHYCLEL